jgi:hypothetical protein
MILQGFRSMFRRAILIPAAGAALLAGGLAACDRMPLTAPSGTAITLVATTNLLPVNGSTDVTAILIEGGLSPGTGTDNPTTTNGVGTPVHNGTLVTFTTSLGRIEPAEARTQNGRATVKLFGDGRSGTATVSAFSGAATQTVEVAIGAAGASRVVLTATPQALGPTGGTAVVTARVEDEQGNGLLGVPVSFSTTAGTLSPTSALTNAEGLATTSLTTTAAATVSATAGASTGQVALTLKARTDLTLVAPTTPHSRSASRGRQQSRMRSWTGATARQPISAHSPEHASRRTRSAGPVRSKSPSLPPISRTRAPPCQPKWWWCR